MAMTGNNTDRVAKNAERMLTGGPRPVIAAIAFVLPFFFAAVPYLAGTDSALVVIPCVIGALSSTLLCLRLLIGDLGFVIRVLLIVGVCLCIFAGQEWSLVALIMMGTILCCYGLNRLVGRFRPLVHTPATADLDREVKQR